MRRYLTVSQRTLSEPPCRPLRRASLSPSSSQVWAELHETALRRLGGVTRVVVLDNLCEGVLKPDIYDPPLTPLYQDMLLHCGTIPCPVAWVIRIARASSSPASATPREPRSKDSASKVCHESRAGRCSDHRAGF